MPMQPNYYFTNPAVASTANNLATAIFGDPEARAKRDYYGSAIELNKAKTGKTQSETRTLDDTNAARAGLQSAVASIFANPGAVDPAGAATVLRAAHDSNANQMASALQAMFATSLGMGTDDQATRSLVLQGKAPNQNFSPSVARSDAVAGRNAGYERDKATTVQRIKNEGDMAVQGAKPLTESQVKGNALSGYLAQNPASVAALFLNPQTTSPGAVTSFAPGDPRASEGAPRIDVPKPATPPKPETLGSRIKADNDLLSLVDQAAGAIYDKAGKIVSGGVDMPPDVRAKVAARARDIIMNNPNLPPLTAAQQAIGELAEVAGKRDGFWDFGEPNLKSYQLRGTQAPQAAQPELPSPVAQAVVPEGSAASPGQSQPMIAPPPMQARVPGKTYQTPKGPAIWTGTGWKLVGG